MDKNTGDPLNRAYEAYRQACMDRDRAKMELQQKATWYEQQLQDQQKQIDHLLVLSAKLSTFAGTGFGGPPPSPKLENSDGWKSETLDSLQEQLKVSLLREKHFKDQLDIEKLHVLKLEGERDKLESVLGSKNEEIQYLKKSLKEAREIKERPDQRTILDTEMRNTNIVQDPCAAATALSDNTRLGVERIFSDLKEEFSRICKLTREQSSQLNTFLMKKEIASDMRFSMPVQCTDEENEEAQILQKPKDKTIRARFAPIAPRGLGPDDDLIVSVESLSNLSVKFPPSSDESDFLESSPGKPLILPPASELEANPNKQLPDATRKNFTAARPSPPYSPRSPRTACHVDKHELGTNYRGTSVTADEDSGLFLAASSSVGDCKNTFHIPDPPDVNKCTEISERTVRGPQQPIWKPSSSPHDNDLSILGSEKWDRDSPNVCEFCQAVFPPSSTLEGDFLRHLNSHFFGPS